VNVVEHDPSMMEFDERILAFAEQVPLCTSEMRVLALLVAGIQRPQIAEMLAINDHTVNKHISLICRKTGIPNVGLLVARFHKPDGSEEGTRPPEP
jgi:DNA-binding CsgD family transcriptional regulator